MSTKRILGLAGASLCCVILFLFGGFSLVEGYNPAYPDIDTKSTPQFDEEKFQQIKVGMDTTEVISMIGQPLGREGRSLIKRWFYTADGKCKWSDFAWQARALVIDQNGKVKLIQQSTRYE
jgi:outer membrane protein assembly factor BamE (lipoprotein component of BamABCDE complex)